MSGWVRTTRDSDVLLVRRRTRPEGEEKEFQDEPRESKGRSLRRPVLLSTDEFPLSSFE